MKGVTVEVSKEEDCIIKAKAKIEKEKYKDIVSESIKKVQSKKSLPGFRVGKVPKERIISSFSDEIMRKTGENIVTEVLHKSIQETGLSAIKHGLRKVDWTSPISLDSDKDVELSIEFEYYPDIEIDIEDIAKSLNIEMKTSEISDDELKALEYSFLKAYFSKMIEKSDGIKKEDVVIFNIENSAKEVVKKEAKLMVDPSVMYNNLFEEMTGKCSGDIISIMLPLSGTGQPIYYNARNQENKEKKQFVVKILSVTEVEVPEMTEEIAVTGFGAESIDDFRKKLKIQASKRKKLENETHVEMEIRDFWFKNYNINIPNSWTEEYINRLEANANDSVDSLNEKEKADLKKDVKRDISFNLALNNFAKKENIDVKENDFMEYINKMVLTGRMTQKQAMHLINSPVEEKYKVRSNILASKAADVLVKKYLDFKK